MDKHQLTKKQIKIFQNALQKQERSAGTIEKYVRDAQAFAAWLQGRYVTKETAAGWKQHLLSKGYAPVTINSMLSALNGLFRALGWKECRVSFLRVQRKLFREPSKELTQAEYVRLRDAAQRLGRDRLSLLIETICATGIRVSELRYITVQAAQTGQAEVRLKGKIRVILLPTKLCRKLLKYAKQQNTASGEIFLSRNGKGLCRRQIWQEMKALCACARVAPSKVFPHNLRHLFATVFYRSCRDIVKLADVLGHSCIETTRIYLLSTGAEHARRLEKLGLVC